VILGLDIAEESRTLSDEERRLRNELKFRCLGLASLNRTIIRQRSKLLYLAEGDANTKKFSFASLPSEKGKNAVTSLTVEGTELVQNEEMASALFSHFDNLLGQPFERLGSIELQAAGVPTADFAQLDVMFSEQEVWETIASLPSDKAPGPDGFTGLFYKHAWILCEPSTPSGQEISEASTF
jgi:hypothetical protein